MQPTPEVTIEFFAEVCAAMTPGEIYEFFEDTITDEMRGHIYTSYPSTSPEPMRAAMIAIGEKYNIQSLKDY